MGSAIRFGVPAAPGGGVDLDVVDHGSDQGAPPVGVDAPAHAMLARAAPQPGDHSPRGSGQVNFAGHGGKLDAVLVVQVNDVL
jgi:hypothetical protein